ncbi:MAG: hypothetical protein AAFX90_20060 [Pseudomonadota bacterium]
MAQQISQLREKLKVLIAHSELSSKDEIAAALGVAPSTLRLYEKGDGVRDPGTVTDEKLPSLLKLLQLHMPGGRSQATVRELLFGPLEAFASAMTATPGLRWPIFAKSFRKTGLTVIPLPEGPVSKGAAYFENPRNKTAALSLAHRSGFKLHLHLDPALRGTFWCAFLQYCEGWDILEIREDKALWHGMGRQVTVPGGTDEKFRLRGATEGPVQFVALACRKPFPDAFCDAISEKGRLSPTVLDHLAYWLNELDVRDWQASASDVYVEPHKS